jgi:hypothetical protein
MTIATVRSTGTQVFLAAALGGLVICGCTSVDSVDDDVKNYTVDDGSLEPIGVHRAALEDPDAPPVALSVIGDAIVAIAVAEEGKGPEEVGVSTGYPLADYADDITGGWCSEFASWSYWRGGCPFSGNWGTYSWMLGGSPQIREWFLDNSRFIYQTDSEWATFEPQPGDYIRYNTPGGGHSGIVHYVEGTTLHTVEGNVNNVVMLRRLNNYKTSYSDPTDGIDGFGVNPCGDGGAGGGTGGQPATGGAGGDASTGGAGGSGGSGPVGTGGETGTGGVATGGMPAGTGGVATGGMPAGTGGVATGGMPAATGGVATGGMPPSTGGSAAATGGAGTGMGGTPAAGGGLGAGGSAAAGGSLVESGGMTATTGGTPPSGAGNAPEALASGGTTAGQVTSTGASAATGAVGLLAATDEGGCACAVPGSARTSGRGGLVGLLIGLCLGLRRRQWRARARNGKGPKARTRAARGRWAGSTRR